MREWSLKIFLLDEDGNERPADVFNKVVYNLHPTFENPVQSMNPFLAIRLAFFSAIEVVGLTACVLPCSVHQGSLHVSE